MFIQTEATPNPETLKFIPGCTVLESGTAQYEEGDPVQSSPLAERLFQVDGIKRVFFGSDFITLTKDESQDWTVLKPGLLAIMMEHFTNGQPVVIDNGAGAAQSVNNGEDSELVTQIKELLDTRIRPAVAQDGGDIEFGDFNKGTLYLHMRGACAGCPSSTATLKAGIENMMRYYIPEVQDVQPIEG